VKLHLGCGRRRLDGFVNIDSRASVKPDRVMDVTDLEGIEDDSASLIYACHVLEHIPRPDVQITLREWRRVLKAGGTLRVAVPDFDAVVSLRCVGVSMWRLVGLLCGRQDYPENTHYMVYNYEYLAWVLGEAGFYDIRTWQPDIVLPLDYDDYSRAKIEGQCVSLNVEATA
jgi:predicted SAM-dependent methyltransferase